MKLTKEVLVRMIKQEMKVMDEATDDMSKIVSPEILKSAEAVAADLKELPALDKAVEDAAIKIAGGNEQLAQVIIPLIRQKFAEA
jgi:hypothetical protein